MVDRLEFIMSVAISVAKKAEISKMQNISTEAGWLSNDNPVKWSSLRS